MGIHGGRREALGIDPVVDHRALIYRRAIALHNKGLHRLAVTDDRITPLKGKLVYPIPHPAELFTVSRRGHQGGNPSESPGRPGITVPMEEKRVKDINPVLAEQGSEFKDPGYVEMASAL